MDGLRQLAWVADAIKSPLLSPPPRSTSLGVLADKAPSLGPFAESGPDLALYDVDALETGRPPRPRRRLLTRDAQRHGVSGLLSAEEHARALVILDLHARVVGREADIRSRCSGRDVSEQLRALVGEGVVERVGDGVNRDPYRYLLTPAGEAMASPARAALAADAAAQDELARVMAATGPRKPAKKAAAQATLPAETAKRKRKAVDPLQENAWSGKKAAKPAAPAPTVGPSTGFAAIYRALSRIKSRKRAARPAPPAPPPASRVRTLAPPPASRARTWDSHWARAWGGYGLAPRRERRAVANILTSIADAAGSGAPVTGGDLRRAFPGCPDHSKALTAVINAGWATRQGAGGRSDPFRYSATEAGLAAAAAARVALAADTAAGR